jgi:hypothetical protein
LTASKLDLMLDATKTARQQARRNNYTIIGELLEENYKLTAGELAAAVIKQGNKCSVASAYQVKRGILQVAVEAMILNGKSVREIVELTGEREKKVKEMYLVLKGVAPPPETLPVPARRQSRRKQSQVEIKFTLDNSAYTQLRGVATQLGYTDPVELVKSYMKHGLRTDIAKLENKEAGE